MLFRVALLCCTFLLSSWSMAEDRFIQVNGVAEASLDPNIIVMTVEVWSKAATAKQAQQLAAQEYKLVKKSFDEFKVKKEDIQTNNYSLNPEYVWEQKSNQNRMVGFQVLQSLNVTLRNVDSAGAFLDSLVSAKKNSESGVNVNSIRWDSDKRSQAEVAVLGEAVKVAKVKAEELAKAAGVKIKSLSKIQHSSSPQGPPIPIMRALGKMAMTAEAAPTELAGGQIKVRVEVMAEYEFQ